MKTLTLIIIVALPTLFLSICVYHSLRLDHWRKNLKAGDRVIIFIGEDRTEAVVHIRYRDHVDVITLIDQKLFRRRIDECY